MQTDPFYNTINLAGEELKGAQANSSKQQQMIFDLFKKWRIAMTPSDVWLQFKQWPITSVRRAITNLTKSGKLEKMGEMKMGLYGKPEHKWKIK